MNYSGVLVSACPGRYDEMLRELDAIDGVEVHQKDRMYQRKWIFLKRSPIFPVWSTRPLLSIISRMTQ